jgi:diguanylate cyclase (GGDEF)-like protein/PAS domain S-box-containing protein
MLYGNFAASGPTAVALQTPKSVMTDSRHPADPQAGMPATQRRPGRRLEQAMHGITSLLLQPLTPAQTWERIIQITCGALGWAGGIAWAHADNQAGGWQALAQACRQDPPPDRGTSPIRPFLALQAAAGAGAAVQDRAEGRARSTPACTTAPMAAPPGSVLAQAAQAAGLHWTVILPMNTGDRVTEVIEFFCGPRPQTDRLQHLAPVLGPLIGQVMQHKKTELEHARFRAALDLSVDEIYLTDRATMRFVDCNATACMETGHTRAEMLQLGPQDVWHTDREQLERHFDEAIQAGPAGITRRCVGRPRQGTPRPVMEVHRRPLRVDDRWLVLTAARDVTHRAQAEQAVERLTRMLAALSATNEAIMRAESPERLYQQVCDAAVDGGGFLTAAILLPHPMNADMVIEALAGPLKQHLRQVRISVDPATPEGRGMVGTAFCSRRACVSNAFLSDERTRPWHAQAANAGIASGAAVPLVRGGHACGVLLFYADRMDEFDDEVVKLLERMAANVVFALDNMEHEAERRRSRERIDYLASHDGLTGLPNRVTFSELLNRSIATARRYQRRFAVMFLDLDRFKLINDSLGHDAGDQLLKEMAARLTACLRDSDVVARLGGDEFVVLVQELGDHEQVAIVARKILVAAMKPFTLLGQECRVTASIGVSIYPDHAEDEPSLMKNADMAMYYAKEEGKNNFQFYSPDIASLSLERLALETSLRRALERNEFTLHYQAKKELDSGRISGVEALLRWHSAELGPVSPAQLIPVAEETGLIVPIGKWVLRTACAQNVAWQRQGLPPVCMAVNLSARQFADPFLLHDIEQVLHDTGMDPQLLELEITEGMVIQHPDKAIKVLTAIKALGVRLAIDDFGTGYSSLGQLKHFPIDTLKVDRSFIRDIPHDVEDRAITEAIIAMGKTLNLTVVAEGVETTAQETFLRQHACDQMQGYLISKPVAPEQFAALLSAGGTPTAAPPGSASPAEPCSVGEPLS